MARAEAKSQRVRIGLLKNLDFIPSISQALKGCHQGMAAPIALLGEG